MSKEKQIFRIDQSALKHSLCMLDFYRLVVLGLRYPINNNDTEFGTAIHLFIKVMYESGGNFNEAVTRALKYFRNTPMNTKWNKKYMNDKHLLATCLNYWQMYLTKDDFEILSVNGKPAVELTFSNKIYEDDNYIIYLEGTIDKFGRIKNGCYAIGDYKSTSAFEQKEFLESFELKTQGRFYLHNLKLFAANNPDSVLNEVMRRPVGFFIDAIFLNGLAKTEYARSRVYMFKEEDMIQYGLLLDGFIKKFVDVLNYHRRTGAEPLPDGKLTDACSANFGCSFQRLCTAPDDIAKDLIMKKDYITKPYMPLLHGKETKE